MTDARSRRRARPGALRGRRSRRRSATAVAGEAEREGVVRERPPEQETEIPREEDDLRVGDPDVSALDAGHVGDSTPGGSTPTPDQAGVDEIGRAYGVEEADSGELRTSTEVLEERDEARGRGSDHGRDR